MVRQPVQAECVQDRRPRDGQAYNAKDQVIANKAKMLFDEAEKRGPGNPTEANQHSAKDETGNVYIIHVSSEERPSGTSAAGLRKLMNAAAEGNEDAAAQLALTQERGRPVRRCAIGWRT